jgi:hypothetical protein
MTWCHIPEDSYIYIFNVVRARKSQITEAMVTFTYLLCGLSPQANYTNQATAACRRS